MRTKNIQGFTVLELMVSTIVLLVVLMIAVPAFTGLVQNNRLTGQVNHLVAGLNLAKAEAVKRNQAVLFCHSADATKCSAPSADGWQGWLVGQAQPRPNTGIVAGSVVTSGVLESEQVTILAGAAINLAAGEIRFLPQGLIRNNNNAPLTSAIRVCMSNAEGDNVRDIGISSGGQIDVISRELNGCQVP